MRILTWFRTNQDWLFKLTVIGFLAYWTAIFQGIADSLESTWVSGAVDVDFRNIEQSLDDIRSAIRGLDRP